MSRDEDDPADRSDDRDRTGRSDDADERDRTSDFEWTDEPESERDVGTVADADESDYPTYTWDGDATDDDRDDREFPRTQDGRTGDENRTASGSRADQDRADSNWTEPTRRAEDRPHRPSRRPPHEPRRGGETPPRPTGDGRRTRDDVAWNFDGPHGRQRAPGDRATRRDRPNAAGSGRVETTDGVSSIDFDGKGTFGFAFSYPFQRGWGPLLKAGLVTLGSVLLLFTPLVFVFGYVFRIARYAAQGRDQPAFEDYGQMLTDGVGYVVVFALWSIGWLLATGVGAELHWAVGSTFGVAGAYLFAAVLTVYPVTGSVAETFTSSRLFDFAFTGFYVKHLFVYVGVLVVLRILSTLSLFALVVGVAWGWTFTFLASAAYWGFVYYLGAKRGVLDPTERADQREHY